MDFPEFYERFLNDLHGFELDSERLAKNLTKGIESIVNEIDKIKYDSEDCREWKIEIHRNLDAYSRAIEAYCFRLKSVYTESFDLIDPKKIAEREEREREFKEKYAHFLRGERDVN